MGQPFIPGQFIAPGPCSSTGRVMHDGLIDVHFEHTTGSTDLIQDKQWVQRLIGQLVSLLDPPDKEWAEQLTQQLKAATGGIVIAQNLPPR